MFSLRRIRGNPKVWLAQGSGRQFSPPYTLGKTNQSGTYFLHFHVVSDLGRLHPPFKTYVPTEASPLLTTSGSPRLITCPFLRPCQYLQEAQGTRTSPCPWNLDCIRLTGVGHLVNTHFPYSQLFPFSSLTTHWEVIYLTYSSLSSRL